VLQGQYTVYEEGKRDERDCRKGRARLSSGTAASTVRDERTPWRPTVAGDPADPVEGSIGHVVHQQGAVVPAWNTRACPMQGACSTLTWTHGQGRGWQESNRVDRGGNDKSKVHVSLRKKVSTAGHEQECTRKHIKFASIDFPGIVSPTVATSSP
jgi:hypothetical protein